MAKQVSSQLTIPKTILVGQQKRSDTYTNRLGYIIYKDEKGVVRKKTSWEGWRDKTIEPLEFENKPTEGFVLNRNGGGGGTSRYSDWHERAAFVRVYDPRDFEFEISIPNLLFILQHCDCSRGKGLEGKFVYSWNGKDLVLLPESCQEYKQSQEFSDLKSMKVSSKELVPGRTFYTKDQKTVVYLGKYNYTCKDKYYYYRDTHLSFEPMHVFYDTSMPLHFDLETSIKETYGDDWYEKQVGYYGEERAKEYLENQRANMVKQFPGQKYLGLTTAKLAKVIDNGEVSNLVELITDLESSGAVLLANNVQVTRKTQTIEHPLTSTRWYHEHDYTQAYIKVGENRYRRVKFITNSTKSGGSYWSYEYKLNGFQMQDLFDIVITHDGIDKKTITHTLSDKIYTPNEFLALELYDISLIGDNGYKREIL